MERLRETRKKMKISQKQLGKIVGCSAGNISKYETGDREPSFATLKKICETLGVSADYLLEIENVPIPNWDRDETAAIAKTLTPKEREALRQLLEKLLSAI